MTQYLFFKFSPNGAPANGKVYSYRSGTYIPKDTFPTRDDALNETNANANPVILDSRGEANIWVKGATKIVLKDSNDNTIWTTDNFDSTQDDLLDDNGNEILDLSSIPNAVNNINIMNAATGSSPVLEGVGEDTNVGVGVSAKGSTGKIELPTGDLNITSGNTTLLSGDINITTGDLTISNGNLTFGSGSVIISDTTTSFDPLPVGLVMWNGSSTVPDGWLECNGAAVSRTTYSALFSLIGTTYGIGDGSTTFNLPDQARNVLVGKGGTGTGTLGNSIGDTGGTETHTLSTSELPSHTHEVGQSLLDKDDTGGTGTETLDSLIPTDPFVYDQTGTAGSGSAHNILQPSLVAMMIIRAY